ncbi:MAG TPA: ribonuclease D [Longimicrobiaceae bacterium]|nr:ribonuclease D [Longimicrobiaceae bacterium]
MNYEYITTPEALFSAIGRLASAPVLGVDTEAAGYHRYHDRISLIQISSRDENVLVDPLALNDLSGLATLFEDASIEKIFHDADFDLRILDRDLDLHIERLFDTQIAAAFIGERGLGLGAVVEKFLGITLPKAYQRADWAERPLHEGMREYAATDTVHLSALRDRLCEELGRLGRLHWAEEEFVRRAETRWSEPAGADEAFLKIKGARDLKPRGLAILREIYGWRESVGKERDQATFRVLSNQSMIEIGLKAPTTQRELRQITGVSSGLAERRGRDILAAVKRGVSLPEGELPRFAANRRWERDPEFEERAERLRGVRNGAAGELGLDPGFLMSRAVLEEIARQMPSAPEDLARIPEVRSWQVEALGDRILRSL